MSTVRHQLSSGNYSQFWPGNLLITDNDWSLVPSIVGYLGSGLTSTPGVDPRTLTAPDPNPVAALIVDQTNPEDAALGAQGGIAEFLFAGNPTIALGGSDTADAPYLVIYLDSTGRKNVTVSFVARDLENTATSDSSPTPLVVQYRTSPTGDWINPPDNYNADATRTPEVPNFGIIGVTVGLGPGANDSATLEVRIMTTNAAGNDEWVGIDDILITSVSAAPPPQGEFVINDVGNIVEGDSGLTPVVFTVTRQGGSQGAVTVNYRLPTPDLGHAVGNGDFAPGTVFNGTLSFADGEVSRTLTFYIRGDTDIEPDEDFSVNLSNPTGGAILGSGGDAFGAGWIINDDPKPAISVADIIVTEGTGGTTIYTFTVARTGSSEAFTIDYATADGTALAGVDYGAISGTLSFAAGQNSRTVDVTVTADALVEADETFFLNLGNQSFGIVQDGQAQAIVNNDDFQTQTGTPGDDIMDGLGGNNILQGLGGNDTYYVDDDEDAVIEAAGAGNDAVYSFDHYVLAAGVEVEWLSTFANYATSPHNLTGNEFAQYLIGNLGANVLDGGGGADIMLGFAGDDIYHVDHAGDLIGEAAGGGTDTVNASVGYALGGGVEVEFLSVAASGGTTAIHLTGNEFAQTLRGNAGANILNGAGGADIMIGLAGNDTYHVDHAGDVVTELGSGGFDGLYASASYVLAAGSRVEFLSTVASHLTDAIDITGNDTSQMIYGNAGSNVLDGGLAFDVLFGLGGADTFAFTTTLGGATSPTGFNTDLIGDFSAPDDTIALDNAIFTALGAPGALGAGAFVTGPAAGDADDRILYNSSTGQLFYDADGTGAIAAIQFATLLGAPALSASDFIVI